MATLINIILLILLFLGLGWSADLVVKHLGAMAKSLRIPLVAFGILLGAITSLPELSLAINATTRQAGALSVGNLLGGVVIMLGLILGISAIFNRKVKTDGKKATLIPKVALIALPLPLGIDGTFSQLDGIIMIAGYIALLSYLFLRRKKFKKTKATVYGMAFIYSIALALGGIGLVVLASHWIVEVTLALFEKTSVSELLIGLLLFSVGTNLPEISIAFTSWRKKSSDLSLNHLLSSSFSNIPILGAIAIASPITFAVMPTFVITVIFLIVLLIVFGLFFLSQKSITRREGIILITIALLFLVTTSLQTL